MPLTSNSYGKIRVRFLTVVRDQPQHEILEAGVNVVLTGDFESSYYGDNSKVIPTDTIKNTVYVVAGRTKATCLEEYGIALAQHFIREYSWVDSVSLSLTQHVWDRISVNGKPHPYAFVAGAGNRTAAIFFQRNSPIKVTSGLKGLRVFKTTDSAFIDYHTDKYTSLKPFTDRTLSTEVECNWNVPKPEGADFNKNFEIVKTAILELFATLFSPSVQDTLLKIGEEILKRAAQVDGVSFALPNIHYWQYHFENLPQAAVHNDHIYIPQPEPSGYITGTVSRTAKAKL